MYSIPNIHIIQMNYDPNSAFCTALPHFFCFYIILENRNYMMADISYFSHVPFLKPPDMHIYFNAQQTDLANHLYFVSYR